MSPVTRTDQKFLSFAFSNLWKLIPGLTGFACRSKTVVFTAFCSSPVRRARLSVRVSAIRKSIICRARSSESAPASMSEGPVRSGIGLCLDHSASAAQILRARQRGDDGVALVFLFASDLNCERKTFGKIIPAFQLQCL